MDQDEANRRYKEWGVLLLLDAPEEIELGIDNTSWKIGHKFKGIKLIPPGPHIIYYALKSEKYMFKIHFFVNITEKQRVIVKKWNEKFEDFISVDQNELERYEHGVNDFSLDRYLGAYPYERYEVWKEVSQHIDQRVLDKLNPIEKKNFLAEQEYIDQKMEEEEKKVKTEQIMKDLYGDDFGTNEEEEEQIFQHKENQKQDQKNEEGNQGQSMNFQEMEEELQKCSKEDLDNNNNNNNNSNDSNSNSKNKENGEKIQQQTAKERKQEEKQERLQQAQKQQKEFQDSCQKEDFNTMAGTIYYTEIPKRKVNHGVYGEQLTKISMDKSEIFEKLLKKDFEGDYKLFFGEFQYAFSSFLLGEHFESFDQWKAMFLLLTNCDSYLEKNNQFGIDLIPVLYGMLKQFPKDFFIDNISADNFTNKCLQDFIAVCQEEKSKKLRDRAQKLLQMLQDKFLFFPVQNQIVQIGEGQYKFENEDEDAPVIVMENEEYISF